MIPCRFWHVSFSHDQFLYTCLCASRKKIVKWKLHVPYLKVCLCLFSPTKVASCPPCRNSVESKCEKFWVMRILYLCLKLRRSRLLYGIFVSVFVFHIKFRPFEFMTSKSKHRIPQLHESILPWPKNDTQKSTSGQNLRYNWLRMHRARTDWRAMLAPCSDQLAWGTLKSGWGKANRTSATNSYVSFMDVQPVGEFTRIFVQTRTVGGQKKRIGGDFWRVYFKGPANVAATVFDHKNGTYEAIALLMESGNYSVLAYLDYTLCDGLRDPPENWFRIGTWVTSCSEMAKEWTRHLYISTTRTMNNIFFR